MVFTKLSLFIQSVKPSVKIPVINGDVRVAVNSALVDGFVHFDIIIQMKINGVETTV